MENVYADRAAESKTFDVHSTQDSKARAPRALGHMLGEAWPEHRVSREVSPDTTSPFKFYFT